MTVAWHYSRAGKKHGPVSSAELQGLARKGLLGPEDLVWKEGMEAWQKAERLKGLFPAVAAAPPLMPAKEAPDTGAHEKEGMSVLASAKAGRDLALKQAEKTKIQTLSLPQAYAAFGKAVYEQGTQHPDTAALFVTIGDLLQQVAAVKSDNPTSTEKATLGERAISLGRQAKAAINAKSLENTLYQQYSQLGTLTYQRADLPSHGLANAQVIHKLLERETELSRQISALGTQMAAHGKEMQQMAKATARKGYSALLTAATVVTFPVAPLSWLPIWKHPRWGKSRKITLALMSLALTIVSVTYLQIQKIEAEKAVKSANAEWDKGNQEEAVTQYRSLLPNSGLLSKDEQVRVYSRLIEFDAEHENTDGARRLIGEADENKIDLSLTEPRATALLAKFQQEKEEQNRQPGKGMVSPEKDESPPKLNDRRSDNGISARDLMELGNSAAVRNKFPGRFVVIGEILQVEDEAGSSGRRQYKVSLVGTLNARGLCNKWVECLMSQKDGLDRVNRGDFVRIEGIFDKAMGACVYMKNCKLSKQ